MTRWPHPPDTLSRRDLEENRMRDLYAAAVDSSLAFSDEQRTESLTATLAAKPKGAGWWVFAYGSLLWNPLFPVAEMRPAMLGGLHRRFCLWSLASRGTRDCPGLVLGLDRGGACRGVAMRLPARLAVAELHLLWRREMVVGSYHPRWVKVDAGGREIVALTFVVRRDHPQYAGRLALGGSGRRARQRLRRVRLVARLSRADARRAGRARHRRPVPRTACGPGRGATGTHGVGLVTTGSAVRQCGGKSSRIRRQQTDAHLPPDQPGPARRAVSGRRLALRSTAFLSRRALGCRVPEAGRPRSSRSNDGSGRASISISICAMAPQTRTSPASRSCGRSRRTGSPSPAPRRSSTSPRARR